MHAGLDPAWACKVCRDSLDLGPMNDVRIAAAMRLGRCDAEMTQANLAPQLHAQVHRDMFECAKHAHATGSMAAARHDRPACGGDENDDSDVVGTLVTGPGQER